MRTDQAPRSALQHVRSLAGQTRQRVVGLGPRVRLASAGVLLAGLALGGYWLAAAEPVTYDWLFDGKPLPHAEAARAVVALRAADIPCQEEDGRVSVPSGRRAEAVDALAQAEVGPRPLGALLAEAAEPPSLLTDPRQALVRERRIKEQFIEGVIRRIKGVVSAHVMLNPIETGPGLRPQQKWRALVMVETDRETHLSSRTVDHIEHIVEGAQPNFEPNGLTLTDLRTGEDYLVAGRPDFVRLSKVKGREEDLRERIAEQIGIEGVRVLVKIEEAPEPAPRPEPKPEPSPMANQPAAVEETPAETVAEPPARMTVLVRVPRSYYLRLFRSVSPGREPSVEDLRPVVSRTQKMIETVVDAALPAGTERDLKIDRIDDFEPAKPALPVAENEITRTIARAWWVPAVAAGVATALVLMLGGRLVVSRWPTARPSRRLAPAHAFETGGASGPSERVRELVRLDPEAAAGVLHRWIAQGGGLR